MNHRDRHPSFTCNARALLPPAGGVRRQFNRDARTIARYRITDECRPLRRGDAANTHDRFARRSVRRHRRRTRSDGTSGATPSGDAGDGSDRERRAILRRVGAEHPA